MKLLEKYGLALLQLQSYSDNDLIIVDGHTLSITEELEKVSQLKQNPEITYYLFGTEPIHSYQQGGISRLIEDVKEYNILFGIFAFIKGETESTELLFEASGYMEYTEISKEKYEQLKKLKKWKIIHS